MSDLSLKIADLSPEKRELLLRRLNEKRTNATRPQIQPQSRESGALPLSFAQRRLWFLDRMEPGTPLYNLPLAMRLTGPLDADALQRSINEIVRRHEILRTTFTVVDGQPVQVVAPEAAGNTPLAVSDLRGGGAAETQRMIDEEAQRPFE